MAIAWPSNPSVNQTYVVGARTYRWTGFAWSPMPGNSYYPGGPDVVVADGGTGASSAPAARLNLGAVTAVASTTAPSSPQTGDIWLDLN